MVSLFLHSLELVGWLVWVAGLYKFKVWSLTPPPGKLNILRRIRHRIQRSWIFFCVPPDTLHSRNETRQRRASCKATYHSTFAGQREAHTHTLIVVNSNQDREPNLRRYLIDTCSGPGHGKWVVGEWLERSVYSRKGQKRREKN